MISRMTPNKAQNLIGKRKIGVTSPSNLRLNALRERDGDNASASPSVGSGHGRKTKDRTLQEIEKLKRQRESRRKSAEEFKRKRADEIKENERKGRPGDVDFQRMIRDFRKQLPPQEPHHSEEDLKINVVVRKRPTNELERSKKDHDSVTCNNPVAFVHHCKLKVDGITKYLDNTNFILDHAFAEDCNNEEVYAHTTKSLVSFALNGGRATCFAYGQTGSGKTYTMAGIQSIAARDVFKLIRSSEHRKKQLEVHCAFFELYGGRCIDLLHERKICSVREDGKGRVQVEGLHEVVVNSMEELLDCIERGNSDRTTHATEMNDVSSRSHAICQIALRHVGRSKGEPYGKLSLIDLAGSERGQDTKHHNRQRRAESAEINKSLLALKECIRALGTGGKHVPYRASKLTMVLKDSFSSDSRTVMISCISPAASSSDHTLNTLRYADRVKEKKGGDKDRLIKAFCGNNNRRQSNAADLSTSIEIECSSDSYDSIESKPEVDEPVTTAKKINAKRILAVNRSAEAPPKPPPTQIEVPSENQSRTENNSRKDDTRNRSSSNSRIPQPFSKSNMNGEHIRSSFEKNRQKGWSQSQWESASDISIQNGSKNKKKTRKSPISRNRQNSNIQKPSKQKNEHSSEDIDQGGSEESMSFHDVVAALVDEEEALLHAHMEAIQKNADLLTQEGELLAKVQGQDVIDYDIDEYASKLDDILSTKLKTFQNLHKMLKRFRSHLALEEVTTKAING